MSSDYFIRWRDADAQLKGCAEGLKHIEKVLRTILAEGLTPAARSEANRALGLAEGMRSMIEKPT